MTTATRACHGLFSEREGRAEREVLGTSAMAYTEYNNWDRSAAVQRALAHADSSGASCDDGKYIFNFAFGSNLNPDKVASRKMFPKVVLRGVLHAWRLLFNHVGGYGNIESVAMCASSQLDLSTLCSPPAEVHGVLLKLTRDEFSRLAWEEYAYDTVEVHVKLYDDDRRQGNGEHQAALAFKSNPCALASSRTLPSARYIGLICDGAQASGIEPQYCSWLNSLRSECRGR